MQKMYYSISEVSNLLGLAPHVLRYWETEFPQLRPRKNRAGSRTYRENDIDLLRRIQQLLHKNRFTVEGARLELQRQKESVKDVEVKHDNGNLKIDPKPEKSIPVEEIRSELREILDLLS